jgi:allantoin racemase
MNGSPPRIRVVNPNSNEAVTRGLDAALEPLRFVNGPEIVCSTLAEGPFGIETQADVECVVMPLRRLVEADNSSDAFVIACYSDPGLHVCREGTTRPVFGIAECGVLTALARGGRFGVIAISQRSISRHMRYLMQMGLTDRLAGERPLEMSVAETASGEKTLERMVDVGRQLKEKDGAETLVMGCAGMARHRGPLERALGIPVIDPTQAAVTMALGTVQFSRP